MITPIRALIFDLDGVLVNTVDLHFRAWQTLADAHGIPFSQPDMAYFRGRHRRDCLLALFRDRHLSDAQINEYIAVKDRAYLALLDQHPAHALICRGAVALLERAHLRGLLIGVASSSVNAVPLLKHIGLYHQFDAIADGSTVPRSKPAPDIFVWVAGALRVRPDECIVFEDAAAGIMAARAGGMYVVGVGTHADVTQADFVVSHLDAMPLDVILDAAEHRKISSAVSIKSV